MSLPSELKFISFLQFSSHPKTGIAIQSRSTCHSIKNDGTLSIVHSDGRRETPNAIAYAVQTLLRRSSEFPFLRHAFTTDAVVIPIPRSAPLVNKDALWPTFRICEELLRFGLVGEIAPVLERIEATRRAATAPPGARPLPSVHYRTTRIIPDPPLLGNRPIVMVDDVITKGSSFIGMYPHVRRAFPKSEITCFALLRTRSDVDVTSLVEPVDGLIKYTYPDGPWPKVTRSP